MRMLASAPVAKKYHSFVTGPVSNAAWVEILAAMEEPCSAVELFSSTGATLRLMVGTTEIPYYILPGGSSIMLPIGAAKGESISIRSADTLADAGILVLNFFG